MLRKPEPIVRTYIGVTEYVSDQQATLLDTLMRKFQSSKRYSRERIHEGMNRKDTVILTKELFIPNSRYMRDAFLEAQASIASQKELLPTYIEQYEQNIKKATQQIELLERKKQSDRIKQIILGKHSKIINWKKQIDYYKGHINQGTVPKIVDGGKERLRKLNQSKITKEEWRDARSNALYSRGEKSKGGNENTKLTYLEENYFELGVLNALSDKKNDRIQLSVKFPDKFVYTIAEYLSTGEAYSIRIMRRNKRYEIHITLEENISLQGNKTFGVAGMDINPDNLSVTIIYPNGNYRASKVFWMNEVNTVSSDKRGWITGQTIHNVMKWIKTFNIDTIVIEDLKFLQTNKNKTFNRMANQFSYSSIIKSLSSIAHKEKIAVIKVKAYYSSVIGKVKYQQTHGISIHQAAAMVLARRGLGYQEKVPKAWMESLFAKEAKQGNRLTDLFKYWKPVKQRLDDTIAKLRDVGIKTKGMLAKKILSHSTIEVPF